MPRPYKVEKKLDLVLLKLIKKDRLLYERVLKKINEILNCYDVEAYKNLKYYLSDKKGAHVGHFVLVFRYDQSNDTVYFVDFDHHDNIYRRKK